LLLLLLSTPPCGGCAGAEFAVAVAGVKAALAMDACESFIETSPASSSPYATMVPLDRRLLLLLLLLLLLRIADFLLFEVVVAAGCCIIILRRDPHSQSNSTKTILQEAGSTIVLHARSRESKTSARRRGGVMRDA
jgi:hypothetical protein